MGSMKAWIDYTSIKLLLGAATYTLGVDLLSVSTGGEVDWRKEAAKVGGLLLLGVGRVLKGGAA
jgi:hypothetical protein